MTTSEIRILPTGSCWCGCGKTTSRGSFFVRGHDKAAEAALLAIRYGNSVAQLLHENGFGPEEGSSIRDKALEDGVWKRCPYCSYAGAPASIRTHLGKDHQDESADQRPTHQEALTRTIRSLRGIWDTQRAVTALHGAGYEVDDKRARQVLRDIVATGLLIKDDPDRAVYRTVDQ